MARAPAAGWRSGAATRNCCILFGKSPWSDERMLTKVRECVLPAIERHGPIEA